MRRKQVLFAYGSYSPAKSAEAQFKQLQNDKEDFLQNFCFYPGVHRYKMKEVTRNEQRELSNEQREVSNEQRVTSCGQQGMSG